MDYSGFYSANITSNNDCLISICGWYFKREVYSFIHFLRRCLSILPKEKSRSHDREDEEHRFLSITFHLSFFNILFLTYSLRGLLNNFTGFKKLIKSLYICWIFSFNHLWLIKVRLLFWLCYLWSEHLFVWNDFDKALNFSRTRHLLKFIPTRSNMIHAIQTWIDQW